MKTLLYLPLFNRRRCFSQGDIDDLSGLVSLHWTEEESAAGLRDWFREQARDAKLLITGWGTPPLTPEELQSAPCLRAIIHAAGTVKRLLPACAWERGIRVASCNRALAVGVAETTLGMIIAGLKGFFYSREWTRKGGWSDPAFGRPYPSVRELFGVRIGVVSASQVGRHLLKLLEPFEVERFLYDPTISASTAEELGAKLVSLQDLFSSCDVITIHAPALPETRHLISAELLALTKENAILINTARGSIVDQVALLRELRTGRFTAILDVTDPEPPAAEDPLRTLPNVVLTSHLSGAVTNGCLRQGRSAVTQVRELLEGKAMHGEICHEVLNKMA